MAKKQTAESIGAAPSGGKPAAKRIVQGRGRTSLNQGGSRKSPIALNGRKPSMGPR
jgi:hypothetical protein